MRERGTKAIKMESWRKNTHALQNRVVKFSVVRIFNVGIKMNFLALLLLAQERYK
jgi:hypothetical protein